MTPSSNPDRATRTFQTHSVSLKSVRGVKDLLSGQDLRWEMNADKTLTIHDVDYTLNLAVTLLEITLNENVQTR